MLGTIQSLPLERVGKFNNEETWTFLAACSYAVHGHDGVAKLAKLLTGRADLPASEDSKIWLEFRPMTPRFKESRTHLDLALGAIAPENATKGGIELGQFSGAEPWICFCEMKWESDISEGVTNDKNRNQLIRVIESALYFRRKGVFAERVHVALVTPAVFKDGIAEDKLYRRKFREYESNRVRVLEDLETCRLQPRNKFNAAERIEALSLRWPAFDELFEGAPNNAVSEAIREFWQKYGSYLNEGR